MSKILFSSFVVLKYESIDKDQMSQVIKTLAKGELGVQDYVKGFVPVDPLRPNDLMLNGGSVARLMLFETEYHDYNKRRYLQMRSAYVAELEAKGTNLSDLKGKEKKEEETKIKEVVCQRMREQGKTNIKSELIPIMVSLSNKAPYLFVGNCPKDEKLSSLKSLLIRLGINNIDKDQPLVNGGSNNMAAYTSFLKDSALVSDVKVVDPLRPDDPPEIGFDIGEVCYLVESNAATDLDSERAKFTHFDLNDRKEIIDLLDNGKDAISCEFRFKYNEKRFKFVHTFDGSFSAVSRIQTKGEKKTAEKPTLSDQAIESVYVMRILRDFVKEMLNVI